MQTKTKIAIGLVVAYLLFSRKGYAMGNRQAVIDLARAQVGLKEDPKGSNSGPQIEKFSGGRKEPWCGHFVAWVFRNAGMPLPGDHPPSPGAGGENPRAGVTATEQMFKGRGELLSRSANVLPGDIVFYATRGAGDNIPGRHIGIVVGVTPDTIETVEGNWGDGVAKLTTRRTNERITGYGRYAPVPRALA